MEDLFENIDDVIWEGVNTDDIQVHHELNPDIWQPDKEMRPEVKKKIQEVVDKFIEKLSEDGVELKPIDVLILGSNAGYNYNDHSDIDVHILADCSIIDCPANLLPVVYNAYKKIFNDKYDIKIRDHEIEIYVEDTNTDAHSSGVYSLKDGWLSEPSEEDIPDIDVKEADKLFDEWEARYNEVMANPTIEKIDALRDDMHNMRQQSILEDGEFGIGNLVFKEFRNRNYMQNLKDKKCELENARLSIDEGVSVDDIKFLEDLTF